MVARMKSKNTKPNTKPNAVVTVGQVRFGNKLPLALIAGPCALESRAHALDMAAALKDIAARLGIGLVYKTSFDKANRTSAKSARGIGLDKALSIFAELREKLGVPVLTDVYEARRRSWPRRGGVQVSEIRSDRDCRQGQSGHDWAFGAMPWRL